MTETKNVHVTDSEALQDTKLFLTLKNGLENIGPKCFLCSQDLSEQNTAIEVSKNIVAAFHPSCHEITFKFFDALFSESLRYYLENGINDLFKKNKDILVNSEL